MVREAAIPQAYAQASRNLCSRTSQASDVVLAPRILVVTGASSCYCIPGCKVDVSSMYAP